MLLVTLTKPVELLGAEEARLRRSIEAPMKIGPEPEIGAEVNGVEPVEPDGRVLLPKAPI